MALQGTAAALSRCELFKGFSETGLGIVAGAATERAVAPGVPIFVEGMASDALFVVTAGRLKILVKDEGGADVELGQLGPGEAVGQLALLQPSGTRLATAVAVEASTVVELRSRDFLKLQAQKPQACVKLMMAIAAQLGRALEQNRDVVRAAARGKLPATGR